MLTRRLLVGFLFSPVVKVLLISVAAVTCSYLASTRLRPTSYADPEPDIRSASPVVWPDEDDDVAADDETTTQATRRIKTILLWNRFFLRDDYGVQLGTRMFESLQCPVTCDLTVDRDRLHDADSVVIHTFHLMKDLANATVPDRVDRSQIFVFMLFENPHRSQPGLVNLPYDDLFNLTFTYLDSRDTDIFSPYGAVRPRPTPDPRALLSYAAVANKTRPVVWLISNCRAPSSRYEYAALLAQHIDLDILGKCGNDSCPRGQDCIRHMNRKYLFYLAFENGYCRDYITEKTFRTLRDTDMVPVVLGGARYADLLPPRSYIDVRDYDSPKHLAEYLLHLMDNRLEYLKYFEWRTTHYVITGTRLKLENFCRLCQILNNDTYPYKSGLSVRQYWTPDMCLTGDDERQAVHIF